MVSWQGFKFNQAGGRQELIRGCAQGGNVKNFYAGWCSFVKTAKQFNGLVSKAAVEGVNDVDIYLNTNNAVVKMEDGNAYDVSGIQGVACVPKDSEAFKGVSNMVLSLFSDTGNHAGAAHQF